MPNLVAIISSHNKKLFNPNQAELQNNIPKCNCRSKPNCPLNGGCCECLVIYKATIISVNPSKHYIGCTENEFKTRFYKHTQSLRHRAKRNATELSKAFWRVKDSGHNPTIKWSIVDRATAYQPGTRNYNLCLIKNIKKLIILLADKHTALNKHSELTEKFWHKNKFKLKNICSWF